LWAARNKTVRRGSRVGLNHSGQYSARGSESGLIAQFPNNLILNDEIEKKYQFKTFTKVKNTTIKRTRIKSDR